MIKSERERETERHIKRESERKKIKRNISKEGRTNIDIGLIEERNKEKTKR